MIYNQCYTNFLPRASPVMKRVPIKGGILLVDDDFIVRRSRGWRIHTDGYVRDSSGKALHREIVGAPDGMVVDHINHDPLDNQRANLRVCTQQQNLWNGRAHRDGSSKYRGVSWYAQRQKWRSQIQGKTLGVFSTEALAALAYNAAAKERFGGFATLNMVPEAGIEPARA